MFNVSFLVESKILMPSPAPIGEQCNIMPARVKPLNLRHDTTRRKFRNSPTMINTVHGNKNQTKDTTKSGPEIACLLYGTNALCKRLYSQK